MTLPNYEAMYHEALEKIAMLEAKCRALNECEQEMRAQNDVLRKDIEEISNVAAVEKEGMKREIARLEGIIEGMKIAAKMYWS